MTERMTETELLDLAIEATDNILQILSVAFGLVSAYIAGLYFFLNRAPFALRLAAFVLLSIGLAFLGVVAFGVHGILVGMDAAWRGLPATASGITSVGGERPAWLGGLSVYEAAVLLGFAVFALVYLALAYVTFIYRWRLRADQGARRDRVG